MTTLLLRMSLFVMFARRTLSFSPISHTSNRVKARTTGAGSPFLRTTATTTRRGFGLLDHPAHQREGLRTSRPTTPSIGSRSMPRRYLSSSSSSSSGGGGETQMSMKNIGFDEMEDLIDDYEDQIQQGQDPGMVVMDVRTDPEVQATGRISENTITLPLQVILNRNVFELPDDDFLDATGFDKPSIDTTLVFTCAAGIRSTYACQAASAAGYRCVNYTGGANEWFSRRRRR